jgi:hypothetical protein
MLGLCLQSLEGISSAAKTDLGCALVAVMSTAKAPRAIKTSNGLCGPEIDALQGGAIQKFEMLLPTNLSNARRTKSV